MRNVYQLNVTVPIPARGNRSCWFSFEAKHDGEVWRAKVVADFFQSLFFTIDDEAEIMGLMNEHFQNWKKSFDVAAK